MKLLVLTTLFSTVLSELDPATLRANGLSRVVRVGRTGRQVVHANRVGDGTRLGKKVRRKGRQNVLLTSSLPTAPVGLAHNPFGFSHAQFNSAPVRFSPLIPAAPQQLVRVASPQPFVRTQPAQLFNSQPGISFAAPQPFTRANPTHPLSPQPIISQPLPLLRAQSSQFNSAPARFSSLFPAAPQQLVRVASPQALFGAPQSLPLLRTHFTQPLAPVINPQPIVRAQTFPFASAPPPLVKTIPLEYGTPATIAPEVKVQAPAGAYGALISPVFEEPEAVTVAPAAATEVVVARAPSNGYIAAPVAASQVVAARAPSNSYIAVPTGTPEVVAAPALAPEIVAARAPSTGYIALATSPPAAATEVVEARTQSTSNIALPQKESLPKAVVKSNIKAATRSEPIAIIRSHSNVPAETAAFDYSFETANGIKQSAVGSVRTVDDTEVTVMEGSYEYIGADGVVYTVVWFADESGFHATAPHLPRNVVPNHPEVAAAVKAQLEEAAVKDATRRRASPAPSSYGVLESDELASYH